MRYDKTKLTWLIGLSLAGFVWGGIPIAIGPMLETNLGFSDSEFTGLMATLFGGIVLGSLSVGYLVDRVFGAQKMMWISTILIVLIYSLIALFAQLRSHIGLFIVISLSGFAFASHTVSMDTLIGEFCLPYRGLAMASRRVSHFIGEGLGFILVPILIHTYGLVPSLWLSVIPTSLQIAGAAVVTGAIYASGRTVVPKKKKQNSSKSFTDGFPTSVSYWLAMFAAFFLNAVTFPAKFFLQFWLMRRDGLSNVVSAVIVSSIDMIFTFLILPMGHLVDKWGHITHILLIAPISILLSLSLTAVNLYVGAVGLGVSIAIFMSCGRMLIVSALWPIVPVVVEAEKLGVANGVGVFVRYSGSVLVSYLVSPLLLHKDETMIWVALSIVMSLVVIGFGLLLGLYWDDGKNGGRLSGVHGHKYKTVPSTTTFDDIEQKEKK